MSEIHNAEERLAFYTRLVDVLARDRYRFQAQDFPDTIEAQDPSRLSRAILLGVKLAPRLAGMSEFSSMFKIHSAFDQEGVEHELRLVRQFFDLVCFKYVLAQPIILSVVEADSFTADQILETTAAFDQALIRFSRFSGSLGLTRLSTTGIVLWAFFEPGKAEQFRADLQKKCKKWHFWKKIHLLPWILDVPAQRIHNHGSLPIISSQILNRDHLHKGLF